MTVAKPLDIDFRKPKNKGELLRFLSIDEQLLDSGLNKYCLNDTQELEKQASEIFELRLPLFHRHRIPKKNKTRQSEHRVVWEACSRIADAYKTFARRFELFLRTTQDNYPHYSAYGYVRGRSTIENAKPHCGKKVILHADIKDFFPSISYQRICSKFIELGINEEVSEILAKFVTINDTLPLGLHSSPMLANLICTTLDNKLHELSCKYDCSYTRYADDISISGDFQVPQKEEIQMALKEEGFILSERKFRITKPGQDHYVTGLSVEDSRAPRAPRFMKRKLRQELYFCETRGIRDHLRHIDGDSPDYIRCGVNRIDGMVRYVGHIEKRFQPDLREKWKRLLRRDGLYPSYKSKEEDEDREFVFFVDESEVHLDGNKKLALSIAVTEDSDDIGASTLGMLQSHISDPYAGGNKSVLAKNKMHYTDANEDLRKQYVDFLSTAPFKGYIAFGTLVNDTAYSQLYLKLLKRLLRDRFMGCDGTTVNIIFEQNSKISFNKLKDLVDQVYENLRETNNRCPREKPTITVGEKPDHACFAIPDFLLAVWGRYIKERNNEKVDRGKLFFERLRDKLRVILDIDNGTVYSRKRPFLP